MAAPTPNITLEPINLHSQPQFDELLRQRIICGWSNTPSDLTTWRSEADAKKTSLFWIIPPSSPSPLADAPTRYAGHVFMSHSTDAAGRPVQCLHQLFVLPEHRASGFGKATVQTLERWARVEPYGRPDCAAIVLNCIKGRYIDDDSSDEWRPFATRVYAKMGLPMTEKGMSNEAWYGRMGFVKESEEPMYPTGEFGEDGREILFVACNMRKELV